MVPLAMTAARAGLSQCNVSGGRQRGSSPRRGGAADGSYTAGWYSISMR